MVPKVFESAIEVRLFLGQDQSLNKSPISKAILPLSFIEKTNISFLLVAIAESIKVKLIYINFLKATLKLTHPFKTDFKCVLLFLFI